jgi:adenylosuccinate synthase
LFISITVYQPSGVVMPVTVVIGTQWGDEGKGKVVDFYAAKADMIVRFQGGNNAGHTIVIGDKTFKLHILPSGILRPKADSVIGNGLVVDPAVLLKEIDDLRVQKVRTGRLHISDRVHIIMPYHKIIDGLEETLKSGKGLSAGTTKRGIGPCYSDKTARFGLRMCDLLDAEAMDEKFTISIPIKQYIIQALGGRDILDKAALMEEYLDYGRSLAPYVTDTSVLINKAIKNKKRVLFEGAQGTHLDIDHGIYPYGTSSSVVAGGACTGAGVGPMLIDEVVGVVKAYTSRVGEGPFPTELKEDVGAHLQKVGHEFGTTTGRPRRCGWLDLVMVRFSARVNGLSSLAITKLDVLSGLDKIKVCTRYEVDGKPITEFPASMKVLARAKPVYKELKGWEEYSNDQWNAFVKKGFAGLPPNVKTYLKEMSKGIGVPLSLISVGPERNQTIITKVKG